MMMSYGLMTLGYGQPYEQVELFRRLASKGEIWSYPQDHIFFRLRMGAMPINHPKALTPQVSLDLTRNVPSSSSPSNGSGGHKGHAGALEKIIQMPVDILYEVGRLSPEIALEREVVWSCRMELLRTYSCASEFRLRDLYSRYSAIFTQWMCSVFREQRGIYGKFSCSVMPVEYGAALLQASEDCLLVPLI
jgi:hypothetical protein